MTRGKVVKARRRALRMRPVYAYVLHDEFGITEIVCGECKTDEDESSVPIFDKGAVVCSRCGEICE